MKTLIIYSTTRGCTEKISEKMRECLGKDVVLINLKKEKEPKLAEYHRVIIGGSFYSGRIQKRIREFCQRNRHELIEKELGLFICSAEDRKDTKNELNVAYPDELIRTAKSTAIFRSSIDREQTNFLERLILRKFAGREMKTTKVDYTAVQQFSRRMDRIFNPFLFIA